MPGDVLPAMYAAALISPLNAIRSSSPKRAVISDRASVKKRRIGGGYHFDYDYRFGSRSGSLALLRVLSAPSSPTPASDSPISSPSPTTVPAALTLKHRPYSSGSQRTQSPPRSTPSTPQASAGIQPANANRGDLPKARRSHNKSKSTSSMPKKENNIPLTPRFPELSAAQALAGHSAIHTTLFLPPASSDVDTARFNPEQYLSASDAVNSLQAQLRSLSKGQNLVFVYPTRRGAQTFVNKILHPVLDPVLRRAVNTHGLKPEAAKKIRHMEAVDTMFEEDDLSSVVQDIVDTANAIDQSEASFHIRSSTVAKTTVSDECWRYHWVKQERSRIRDIIKEDLSVNGGAPVEMAGISVPRSPIRVAEEFLEEIKNHNFEAWEQGGQDSNQPAVEVGVFVLARY